MAEIQLSSEAQQLLAEMQMSQQQFQSIELQKEALSVQKNEIENALEELEKSDSEEVYKAVGPILVRSDKKTLVEELSEKKETIDLRLKTLEKQETKTHSKLKDQQEKLQSLLKGVKLDGEAS